MSKNINYRGFCFIIFILIPAIIFTPSVGFAQTFVNLPPPGEMVFITPSYDPVIIKGLKTYPEQPFRFDFYIDRGEDNIGADIQAAPFL